MSEADLVIGRGRSGAPYGPIVTPRVEAKLSKYSVPVDPDSPDCGPRRAVSTAYRCVSRPPSVCLVEPSMDSFAAVEAPPSHETSMAWYALLIVYQDVALVPEKTVTTYRTW